MRRRVRAAIAPLLIASFASAQNTEAPVWDGQSLPITIETLHDVPVKSTERRPDGSYGQERGTLYSGTSFRIDKGQRFQMVAMLGEGSCRIGLQGALYELSSCPWMPGFTDQQTDVFRIVAFDNR
jgi:hypothetical protein